MMSFPFFFFFFGLIAAWFERRTIALKFWSCGVVFILVLLSMHATNKVNIAL